MKNIVVVLTFLAFGVLFSTDAQATTYFVATNGADTNPGTSVNPFLTLHKAATIAAAGDTVVVRPGTYAGARFGVSGSINAPITITGESGAIINAPGPSNSNGDNLWIRDASYITIQGFEIVNAPRAGIAVQAEFDAESHGVILRDNNIHNNGRWGIFTAYAEGIQILRNVTSFSGIEHGVYVSNSSDNPVIQFNIVHHNNASGIQINADPEFPGDGITSNANVSYNVIFENGVAGGAGINLASVITSRIYNNLLYNNHASGIAGWDNAFSPAFGTHDNTFYNNTIVQASNGRFALSLLNGSSNNEIKNNILIHPGSKGSISVDASSESGLQSNFNTIVDRFEVDETFITAAAWKNRGHDANSPLGSTASLFVDAANLNFRLKVAAPAIDAGTAVQGLADDLDLRHRPQGLGVDMGAMEFRGVATPGTFVAGNGSWFLRNANSSGNADSVFFYGAPGTSFVPLAGDWDGDGDSTPGLYDPANGAFFLKNSNSNGPADVVFTFGAGGNTYIPVVGDWDGDGDDTIGLYNPTSGVFFLKNVNAGGAADLAFFYGPQGGGWRPLAGDWDGDGDDTVGLYDPGAGAFFLRNINGPGGADLTYTFGSAGLMPVAGDWNGDNVDTVGIYVQATGTWFLRNSHAPGAADAAFPYGAAGWTPVTGDWDGR